MLTTALVLAALAGVLHVGIFVLESFLWTTPRARAAFATGSVAEAEATRPMAYNQGFYNLFLALGALVGVVVVLAGQDRVGWTLVVTACASMVAAALVLTTTGAQYRSAAAKQGTLPALALVAALLGVLVG